MLLTSNAVRHGDSSYIGGTLQVYLAGDRSFTVGQLMTTAMSGDTKQLHTMFASLTNVGQLHVFQHFLVFVDRSID